MILKDEEFLAYISEIITNDTVQNLKNYEHHKITNRFNHSLHVSYSSYKLGKHLNLGENSLRELSRAGLLHDFFFYDTKSNACVKNHLKEHPLIALENAENLFDLNEVEKNIILTHMFGISFSYVPKYKESLIVCYIDKIVSIREVCSRFKILRKMEFSWEF